MIERVVDIDFMWPTREPFLFCVHHHDNFPAGNENRGVDSHHFTGRQMGSDFVLKDGFRLYHGEEIPGFPVHPHRGFETITIVRQGLVDHADSLGAAGRYGNGDVQWMTAGSGVQHSEMFPLLNQEEGNTLELFQIWLNLPQKNKMVSPDFKMIWAENIPKISTAQSEVSLICGEYSDKSFNSAPSNSWASDPSNKVNIFLVKLKEGATFSISKCDVPTNRTLYLFQGNEIEIGGQSVQGKKAILLKGEESGEVRAVSDCEFLFLEARPIGEPVAQHGPFVMNTQQEIIQAFNDYQRTQFGGWPWPRKDMIHGTKRERFAKYPDGRKETP